MFRGRITQPKAKDGLSFFPLALFQFLAFGFDFWGLSCSFFFFRGGLGWGNFLLVAAIK